MLRLELNIYYENNELVSYQLKSSMDLHSKVSDAQNGVGFACVLDNQAHKILALSEPFLILPASKGQPEYEFMQKVQEFYDFLFSISLSKNSTMSIFQVRKNWLESSKQQQAQNQKKNFVEWEYIVDQLRQGKSQDHNNQNERTKYKSIEYFNSKVFELRYKEVAETMKLEKNGETVFLNDVYQVYHLAIVEAREKAPELIPKLNCYRITKQTFNLQSVSSFKITNLKLFAKNKIDSKDEPVEMKIKLRSQSEKKLKERRYCQVFEVTFWPFPETQPRLSTEYFFTTECQERVWIPLFQFRFVISNSES